MRIGGLHTYQDEEGSKAIWSLTPKTRLPIKIIGFIKNDELFVLLENHPRFDLSPELKILNQTGIVGWMLNVDLSLLRENPLTLSKE